MLRFWSVACWLGAAGLSLRVNPVELEGNHAENYDNEIYEDQQEGEPLSTPCHADFSRWDKLFIALEDSHMRQNMLLEAVQLCGGGVASLSNQVDRLAKGACQQCAPSLESALQMILGRCEEIAKPRDLLEAESRMGNPVTQRPGSLGVAFSSGVKPFLSAHKEQEVTSTSGMALMEKALVAIAMELQKVHLQLSRVIQQAETRV